MKTKTTRQCLITTAAFAMAVFAAHPAFANSSTPPTISIDSTPPALAPNLPGNTQPAKTNTSNAKQPMSDGEIAGIAVGSTAGAAAIAGVIRPWQKGSGKLNLTGSAGASGTATDVSDLSSLSEGTLRRLAENGIGTGRSSIQLSQNGRIPLYTKNESGQLVDTGETVSVDTASRAELLNAINKKIASDNMMLGAAADQDVAIRTASRLAQAQEEWAGRTRLSGLIPKARTRVRFAQGDQLTNDEPLLHAIDESEQALADAPKPAPASNVSGNLDRNTQTLSDIGEENRAAGDAARRAATIAEDTVDGVAVGNDTAIITTDVIEQADR